MPYRASWRRRTSGSVSIGASRRVRLELRQAPDALLPHVAPGNVRDYQRHTGAWSELDCDLSEGLRQREAGTGGLGQRDRASKAVQAVRALRASAVGALGRTNYERPARSVTPNPQVQDRHAILLRVVTSLPTSNPIAQAPYGPLESRYLHIACANPGLLNDPCTVAEPVPPTRFEPTIELVCRWLQTRKREGH